MAWTCEVCGRIFTQKDQPHACASHSLETNFSGVKAKWLPLYQRLLGKATVDLPEFTEFFPATGVMWRHSATFAEIKCKQDALEALFFSQRLRPERNPTRHLQTSANRVIHVVEFVDETIFADLMAWILESYRLTLTNKPRNSAMTP